MNWFRILIFLTLVITIWGGIHFYVYKRTIHFLNISGAFKIYLALAIFILFFSYPLIRAISGFLPVEISLVLHILSTLWIGMVFYLFLFFILADLITLILSLAFPIPKVAIGIAVFILTILTVIYGYIEANRISTRKITIKIENLNGKELRIVHLSDLHLGLNFNYLKLKRMIPHINKFSPDLVLITGDILDEKADRINKYKNLFSEIQSGLGIFAVTGNHEFYAGNQKSIEFLKSAGITLLRNQVLTLNNVEIAGVDDEEFLRNSKNWKENLKNTLKKAHKENMLILLKHRPTGFDIARENGVGLMLCGHTHRAQLFPLHFITSRVYRYFYGYHIEGKMHIYVNSGLGTWGPPLRLFAPPEIVFITLKPAPSLKPAP